jgi:hypothetical protein
LQEIGDLTGAVAALAVNEDMLVVVTTNKLREIFDESLTRCGGSSIDPAGITVPNNVHRVGAMFGGVLARAAHIKNTLAGEVADPS